MCINTVIFHLFPFLFFLTCVYSAVSILCFTSYIFFLDVCRLFLIIGPAVDCSHLCSWVGWLGVRESEDQWVRSTTDELDSCDPYLGDQTLVVSGGVWANQDSAVLPEHCVTTPALHYTLARRNVL